ncbi:MAG: NADH-ubiquinone oxidoreductase-F iron-sulfur binding region domain-containing protein [Eubacteriales bacterium]
MYNYIPIEDAKKTYEANSKKIVKRIVICAGTGCVANGSLEIKDKFVEIIKSSGLNAIVELKKEEEGIHVSGSGCQGFCQMGPLVTIFPSKIMYCKVALDDVEEIVAQSIVKDGVVDRLVYELKSTGEKYPKQDDIPFYAKQNRFILKQCGTLNPEDINEFIAEGGYEAAKKSCTELSQEEICRIIQDSGLKGRGGGGFPTGLKWEFTRRNESDKKYVICNGDEGDPGAFMDRSVMEGNPHSVIEGMIVCAMAIGADEGYVYVRAEYPLAVKRVSNAVAAAEKAGILGENIFNSGKNFKITVMEGAGAFVCGEETALMSSIEGNRGMPMPKPPFPAEKGLFGKPTVINNVETLASIGTIMQMGADKFKAIGMETASGTKTFALTGHVVNTGLIEVPFGTTLRHIIANIAGGVVDADGNVAGTDFKSVQIGGPSGGCLTQQHLDLPLDYDSLKTVGAMVGSGGLVVMNHSTCMVEIARYFMEFTQNESCGKCVVCREGTKQMLNLLTDITEGRGTKATIDLLEELAHVVQKGSLCALGKTAPNPVLSTLKYFRDEYMEHVIDKKCRAGECTALKNYKILDDKCIGCGLCARKCPVSAIEGEKKQPHTIDIDKCIKCGACIDSCKFGAVVVE